MWFFSKARKSNAIKPKAPKHSSTLGRALRFAFLPAFGESVRPIQQTTDVFTQLLAVMFIAQKMFPADHPAYLGTRGKKLTLGLLLSTVWRDLKFSRETAPQVAFFVAVIVSFAFGVLGIVVFFLSAFMGTAHAQGYFDAPGGSGDIAQSWIDFLFNGGSLPSSFFAFSDAQPLVGVLIQALGFYSDAILVVAAAVLFYHLASMVVETAHEGVVMGKKANQIWAPIRLVVAIGLLVPIGGGLNSGQYIVIRMVEWGSGLASNVWSILLGGFAAGTGAAFVPSLGAADAVYNTILSESCMATYNAHTQNKQGDNLTGANAPGQSVPAITDRGSCKGYGPPASNMPGMANSGACGNYCFSDAPEGSDPTASAVGSLAQSCFQEMQQDAQEWASEQSKHFYGKPFGGSDDQPTPQNDGHFGEMLSSYLGCLGGLPVPSLAGVFAQSAAWGWVSAGAVLTAITQAEANANDISALIPATTAPEFAKKNDTIMKRYVAPVVSSLDRLMAEASSGGGGGGGSIGSDGCASQRSYIVQKLQTMSESGSADHHLMERLFEYIDLVAGWNCVWRIADSGFALGIQFDTGVNPLAQMAHLGHANIDTAYDVFDFYVNLMANKGADIAKADVSGSYAAKAGPIIKAFGADASKGALQAIGSVLVAIIATFFTTGVLLAYYVPLIPLIQYLFSVMTWVISVMEAIVAAPLLALAHLTVKDDGIYGSMAKQGYFFIFNIFLRPVVTVFALVIGLLVLYLVVDYMNLFYTMAVVTSGGMASGHLFLSRLVYSALYVIIIYTATNSAFKVLSFLPEHCIKWMGAAPMHFHQMGDAHQVAGPLMQGAGRLEQNVLSQVQQNPLGAGIAFGGAGGLGGQLANGGSGGSPSGGGNGGGSGAPGTPPPAVTQSSGGVLPPPGRESAATGLAPGVRPPGIVDMNNVSPAPGTQSTAGSAKPGPPPTPDKPPAKDPGP